MAALDYPVMTSTQAKAVLAKKGILMPWQEGHEDQLKVRTPEAMKAVEEITNREEKQLEEAQLKKVKKAIGSNEGEVAA